MPPYWEVANKEVGNIPFRVQPSLHLIFVFFHCFWSVMTVGAYICITRIQQRHVAYRIQHGLENLPMCIWPLNKCRQFFKTICTLEESVLKHVQEQKYIGGSSSPFHFCLQSQILAKITMKSKHNI